MSKESVLRNPHLDGSSFFWEAGTTGVLLVHGFTATTTEVRLLAGCLHGHGYTVAGPLLPGHGTTPQDCNRHTWRDWYAAVEQAYQQLATHCMRVVVGGESTGALLALQLAYRHPEVSAILCYAPALRLKLGKIRVFLLTLCAPFLPSIPKPPAKDDSLWQGYGVYPLKGAYHLKLLQKAIYSRLPEIHQPVLIVQGRLDPTVHPRSPEIIYERASSTVKELHWLERSTHCVILDKEHELAEELSLDFLRRMLN